MARILHISASPDFAQYVDRILPALVNAGHEVHFVSAEGPEPNRLLSGAGVTLHTSEIVRHIAPASDVRSLAQLVRLMWRLKPDLVHAHTPKGGLLGMLAARQTKISARIYQIHGLRYETTIGTKRRLLMGCEQLAANSAHKVICVSPSVRERALEDGILSKDKACVLANGSAQGIDLTRFDPAVWESEAHLLRKSLDIPPEAACVLYIGRLAADKGLSDLAAAWLSITESRADAHLILAGAVDSTDPFDVAILGTLPRVHLLPHQDDPRPLLALADVVTLPSYREGLPQTILEAGAMKKPVVAASVTGVVDTVLDGRSGLLVPPRDPQGLARALLVLLGDAELRQKMGEIGRENVGRRFQFEPIVRETLALYESVLSPGATR